MEMEKKKNKRVTREEEEESEKVNKKLKGEEEEEEGGVPTEEEVEEFFAILRRMRVAVKYFDDKRGGREWREALETAELPVDHAVAGEGEDHYHKAEKKGGEGIVNEGFDLNAAAPEAAEGGGA
uniref:Uncharacterized protein n=1 Tax=Cajanus cajan TaxID=3821 RepID=A0A151TRP7_CAJCA|nr:hypothetical protein KK1_008883 [Cajanus cajan]